MTSAFLLMLMVVSLAGFGIPVFFRGIWPRTLVEETARRAVLRGYHLDRPSARITVLLLSIARVLPSGRISRALMYSTLPVTKRYRWLLSIVGASFFFFIASTYAYFVTNLIWPTPLAEVSGRVRLLYFLESRVCPTCQSGVLVAWFFMTCLIAFPIWGKWNRTRYFRWDEREGRYIRLDRNKKQRR